MYILPNELHIWKIDLFNSCQQLAELYHVLSKDEQNRANNFYHKSHQESFILARGILRKIIGNYIVEDPCQIEFSYNEYGKPFLKKRRKVPLYFNISHSEDLALCIFSKKTEVGIDIEKVSDLDNYHSIAKQFFSEIEYNELRQAYPEHKLNVFFKIWTLKEAFVKAIGVGLGYPLKDFDVISNSNKVTIGLEGKKCKFSLNNWNLNQINIQDGYQVGVAYMGYCKKINYFSYF